MMSRIRKTTVAPEFGQTSVVIPADHDSESGKCLAEISETGFLVDGVREFQAGLCDHAGEFFDGIVANVAAFKIPAPAIL